MDVQPMMREVVGIPYAMVRKASFPNLARVPQFLAHGMGEPALNKLQSTFNRDLGWSQQQMKMLRHEHKSMELKLSLAAIRIERLNKQTRNRLGEKQARSLPGNGCYEISTGR
jgi:hypothetical protein